VREIYICVVLLCASVCWGTIVRYSERVELQDQRRVPDGVKTATKRPQAKRQDTEVPRTVLVGESGQCESL